jgi:endonuclease-3 related protein
MPLGQWLTLVRIVLDRGSSSKKGRDWSWLEESPLRTPEETSRVSGPVIEEMLDQAGLAGGRAGVLPALAEWWLNCVGDRDASAVFGRRPLPAWQEQLRAIRGVSWELADRILLFVGGLAVYPLDRGSMRIAARHGWMDLTAEYDDWQAFFVGGLRETGIDLAEISFWSMRVGREFCGAQPKCNECPLKELLPERGPVPLSDDD